VKLKEATINYAIKKASEKIFARISKIAMTISFRGCRKDYRSPIIRKRSLNWPLHSRPGKMIRLQDLLQLIWTIANQQGFITNVSVLKEQMGKGIAETLMNNCIAYAKQQGIRSIDLEVSKGSEPAIALYRKFGFLDCGNKEDQLQMKVIL